MNHLGKFFLVGLLSITAFTARAEQGEGFCYYKGQLSTYKGELDENLCPKGFWRANPNTEKMKRDLRALVDEETTKPIGSYIFKRNEVSAEDKKLLDLKIKEILGITGDGKRDQTFEPEYCSQAATSSVDFYLCKEKQAGAAMITGKNYGKKRQPATDSASPDKPTIEAYPNVDAMWNYVDDAR